MTRLLRWLPSLLFIAFAIFLGLVIRAANTGQGHRYWSFLEGIPLGDKLGHLLLMGTLCLLLNLALRCRTIRLQRRRILLGSVLVVSFVIIEECSQIFLPSRTFSAADLLADAVGIGIGGWVAGRLYLRSHDRIVPSRTNPGP